MKSDEIVEILGQLEKIVTLLEELCDGQKESRRTIETGGSRKPYHRRGSGFGEMVRRAAPPRAEAVSDRGGDLPVPTATPARELIAAYCDAFKARHGIFPVVDGKTAGLAKYVLQAVPLEKAKLMVQAYLQMDDPWFKTRFHDFDTFRGNLSKVAVSLANGTRDPHEREYWRKVFGDGEVDLRTRIEAYERDVGGEELPLREGRNLLAGPPERF